MELETLEKDFAYIILKWDRLINREFIFGPTIVTPEGQDRLLVLVSSHTPLEAQLRLASETLLDRLNIQEDRELILKLLLCPEL